MKAFERAAIRNEGYRFLPGLTWALRARRFSPSALRVGAITTTRGSGSFSSDVDLLLILGWGCSTLVDALLKVSLGRGEHPPFDLGDISNPPWPLVETEVRESVSTCARDLHNLVRSAICQTKRPQSLNCSRWRSAALATSKRHQCQERPAVTSRM